MLIAARRLSYYISNPRIVHEKYQLKSDKCLSFVTVPISIVPSSGPKINKDRHHDIKQT